MKKNKILVLIISLLLVNFPVYAEEETGYKVINAVVTNDREDERDQRIIFVKYYNEKTYRIEKIAIQYCVLSVNKCEYIGPKDGYAPHEIVISNSAKEWTLFSESIFSRASWAILSPFVAVLMSNIMLSLFGKEIGNWSNLLRQGVGEAVYQVLSTGLWLAALSYVGPYLYFKIFYKGISRETYWILSFMPNYNYLTTNHSLRSMALELINYLGVPEERRPELLMEL